MFDGGGSILARGGVGYRGWKGSRNDGVILQ